MPPLLEREGQLAALDAAFAAAADGRGAFVLVAGDAGMGKSALVRAVRDRHRDEATVWWGICDALETPRPLGPIADIAAAEPGLAGAVAEDTPLFERLTALVDAIRVAGRPVLMVIEDVHWADAATRDALVFLARRVGSLPALILATHRLDGLDADHPLRLVLGRIATVPDVHRIALPPLSPAAVAALAGPDGDTDALVRLTGGNPFFVTEAIGAAAAGLAGVPPSVADAVLARAAELDPVGRTALDAAAVVPDSVELAVLRQLLPSPHGIDECVQRGLLALDGDRVRFRHELARLAVEQALPPVRRQDLHSAVLAALVAVDAEPARLAHHAGGAGDRESERRYAVLAADRASRLGARREAARHLERALALADDSAPSDVAALLERYADECFIIGRQDDSRRARGRALELWRGLGATEQIGLNLARSSTGLPSDERIRRIREAVALLEPEGPSRALAFATAQLAYALMLAREVRAAIEVGERAAALAERLGDALALSRALNAVGSSQWFLHPDRAEATLLRAMEVAADAGDLDRYADAMINLGSAAGEVRQYDVAERWLLELLDWSTTRDFDIQRDYALAWLARVLFETGRWQDADERLRQLGDTSDLISRIVALGVAVRLGIRRGEDVDAPLAEATRLAQQTGDLQRLWPVAVASAERAWLSGDTAGAPDVLMPAFELSLRVEQPWAHGELAIWLARCGRVVTTRAVSTPFQLELEGRWREAATAWGRLGCPYEQALALVECDDDAALSSALEVLGRLGARPLGDQVAARLRARGAPVPRRPSPRTLAHAGLLTEREHEVLERLADGDTNARIAATLHLSAKTVGHHVSAILQKLAADRRADAVERARQLGILPPK